VTTQTLCKLLNFNAFVIVQINVFMSSIERNSWSYITTKYLNMNNNNEAL
jgi:hypothetical protein